MELFDCRVVGGRVQVAISVEKRRDNREELRSERVLFSPWATVKVGYSKGRVIGAKAGGKKLRAEKRQMLTNREN